MTRTHGAFFTSFLKHLELPVTTPALRALAVVSIFESSEGNEKWNNPLACEQAWPRTVDYNPAGVKRYATFYDGVDASAEMYRNPAWAGVRAAIAAVPADASPHRNKILHAFNTVYDGWANVDFTRLPYNTTAAADARLAHPLYGP